MDVPQMLRDHRLSSRYLEYRHFRQVTFGRRESEVPPATLAGVSFASSTFCDVEFANTALAGVYFRGATFTSCDLRYVTASRTSFQECAFTNCDFYRAFFESAAVFTDASVTKISLDKAWLDGITGLDKTAFDRGRRWPRRLARRLNVMEGAEPPPALIQETNNKEEYEDFLQVTTKDRPVQHPTTQAIDEAKREAATVYRALSGLWTAQAQFIDASWAYAHSKDLERYFFAPWRVRRVNNTRRRDKKGPIRYGLRGFLYWLWLWIAGATARYGESLWRIAAGIVGLTLVPGIVYSLAGGVRGIHGGPAVRGIFKCWEFSFEQMTSATSGHWESSNNVVDLVGSFETVLGVALLGLLGFVLAQKLRNA